MSTNRKIAAHIISVPAAAVLLTANIGWVAQGPIGWVDSLLRGISGLLIYIIIAFVTIPIGLMLRKLAEYGFKSPKGAAIILGALTGIAIIPLLHPAMYTNISFSSHPLQLLAAHLVAGILGGLIWWFIEKPEPKT